MDDTRGPVDGRTPPGPRAVAVVSRGRELWEESTLQARVDFELLAAEHDGREARYFLMTDVIGTPELSGPELEPHSPDNSFELVWAGVAELGGLGLQPEHLRTDLPRLLGLS